MITTLGQSVIAVSTRKLKEINFAVIQFNYALMSSIVMAVVILVLTFKNGTTPFSYENWWIYAEMFAASVLNMLAQNVTTISNQNANPATVSLYSYMGVMYNFACDWLLFELSLNLKQKIGVAICLSCSVSAAIYKIHV